MSMVGSGVSVSEKSLHICSRIDFATFAKDVRIRGMGQYKQTVVLELAL